MQRAKKIVLVVVLLAVIATTVWLTIKRFAARTEPPAWFRETVDEKIDRKTLKVIALPRDKWHRLECSGPREWKNPETGESTVTDIMICASCGEKIPWPDVPVEVLKAGPGQIFAALGKYMCPKCGGHAWGGRAAGGGHVPPPSGSP